MNRHSLTLTQIMNNLADTGLVFAIYDLATVFGSEKRYDIYNSNECVIKTPPKMIR